MSSLRIAVTGATGFVGQRLVQRLAQNGHTLLALRRTEASPPTSDATWITGDMNDPAALAQLVAGVDVVVHLASYVHRPVRHAADDALCWKINRDGTRLLVEQCAAASTPPFLLFVSSAAVYGPAPQFVRETAQPQPVTPYGCSKLAAEAVLLAAIVDQRLTGCVVRPCVIYGPAAPGNIRRLLGWVRRGWVPQFGRHTIHKSLLYSEHALTMLAACIAHRTHINGQIYNLADGLPLSVPEIVEALALGANCRPRLVSIPPVLASTLAGVWDVCARRTRRLPLLSPLLATYQCDSTIDAAASMRDLNMRLPITTAEALRQTALWEAAPGRV